MGQPDNHPHVTGDEKIKQLVAAKKLPGNVDPKVKFALHSAANQTEIMAAYDKLVPPASKTDPKANKEADKAAAEVKAKLQKEREEAHAKDPGVRLDPVPGTSEVGVHEKPEEAEGEDHEAEGEEAEVESDDEAEEAEKE